MKTMKQLIDFDRQFNEYMDNWAEELLKQGKKPEEIEELIPQTYADWMKKASAYFAQVEDGELIAMLGAYLDEEISVHDALSERVVSLPGSEQALYAMFQQEDRSDSDRIFLMNLLSDMDSLLPVQNYIRLICKNENPELADAAAEALKYMGTEASAAVLEAYEEEQEPEAKERLMYVLVYCEPVPENLAEKLILLMKQSKNKALIAGFMAAYGDDRCLEALHQAENARDISYIDYVEICDAIEALGGETARDREFDGDEYYEMIHNGGLE